MSGLASKWATEEELVNKAKIQDSESRKHGIPSQKPTIPKKSDTSKPLESKWANIASEPSKVTTYKDNHNKFNDSSKYNRSGRRNRGRNDRKYGNDGYGTLPSPPSTAENDASPNSSNDSHVSRGGSGNPPRGPRGYKPAGNNKQRKQPTVRKVEDEESEDERTIPMSKAGASLAARLGVASKSSTNSTRNSNEDDFESTDEEVTGDDDDDFEDIVESEDDEEQEELPPMTSAGQSLASRLGMVSLSNTKPEPPKPKQNFKQTQLQSKNSNIPPRQPKSPKGSYQTPKQKREGQARREQEEKERLQKQKDAKLKEEVRDMFSKLTSSSANWADLEDED